jgi:hypothetical protein
MGRGATFFFTLHEFPGAPPVTDPRPRA